MRPKRILLVDDEKHIADVVVYILEDNGFDIRTAMDGDTGLKEFESKAPDLVILDLNLPGISGLDLFRHMRRVRPDVPIIMLTSRSEELDRVVGLEMGADDYVTKPFSPRELAARVRAVLRRASGVTDGSASELRHGPIVLEPEQYTMTYFGDRVMFTRPEFRLMECLVRHPARVFTRDMLMDSIYDGETVVTDRSIDAYVKRIRRKLAEIRRDANPIETVYGLCYKLNQEIETMA